MQREDILAEIRRTTQENGGKPLGTGRFEQETGIRPYDWSKHWVRFSEAQREAGFEPNKLMGAYEDDYMLEKLAELVRELKHFPVKNEMRIKRRSDSTLPSLDTYARLGNKEQLIAKVLAFCENKSGWADITKILEPLVGSKIVDTGDFGADEKPSYGFVYLIKGHPGEYKIGRTNLVDRRVSELGATASIDQQLIHEIKTDDPSGIELYWHKRFAAKRMKGEWFRLNAADVKTFRRWRRIY